MIAKDWEEKESNLEGINFLIYYKAKFLNCQKFLSLFKNFYFIKKWSQLDCDQKIKKAQLIEPFYFIFISDCF